MNNFHVLLSKVKTDYLENYFGTNFDYLLSATNQSEKPTDLKWHFDLLMTISFLLVAYTSNANRPSGAFILAGLSILKCI